MECPHRTTVTLKSTNTSWCSRLTMMFWCCWYKILLLFVVSLDFIFAVHKIKEPSSLPETIRRMLHSLRFCVGVSASTSTIPKQVTVPWCPVNVVTKGLYPILFQFLLFLDICVSKYCWVRNVYTELSLMIGLLILFWILDPNNGNIHETKLHFQCNTSSMFCWHCNNDHNQWIEEMKWVFHDIQMVVMLVTLTHAKIVDVEAILFVLIFLIGRLW